MCSQNEVTGRWQNLLKSLTQCPNGNNGAFLFYTLSVALQLGGFPLPYARSDQDQLIKDGALQKLQPKYTVSLYKLICPWYVLQCFVAVYHRMWQIGQYTFFTCVHSCAAYYNQDSEAFHNHRGHTWVPLVQPQPFLSAHSSLASLHLLYHLNIIIFKMAWKSRKKMTQNHG